MLVPVHCMMFRSQDSGSLPMPILLIFFVTHDVWCKLNKSGCRSPFLIWIVFHLWSSNLAYFTTSQEYQNLNSNRKNIEMYCIIPQNCIRNLKPEKVNTQNLLSKKILILCSKMGPNKQIIIFGNHNYLKFPEKNIWWTSLEQNSSIMRWESCVFKSKLWAKNSKCNMLKFY